MWGRLVGRFGGPFGGYRDDICGRLLGMKVVMRMVRFERIFLDKFIAQF